MSHNQQSGGGQPRRLLKVPQMKGALLRDVPSLPIAQVWVSGRGQLHCNLGAKVFI